MCGKLEDSRTACSLSSGDRGAVQVRNTSYIIAYFMVNDHPMFTIREMFHAKRWREDVRFFTPMVSTHTHTGLQGGCRL